MDFLFMRVVMNERSLEVLHVHSKMKPAHSYGLSKDQCWCQFELPYEKEYCEIQACINGLDFDTCILDQYYHL